MMILKKDLMELKIDEFGAEMKSFTINGIEFLWNKDKYWKKTSPVLFPFVGNLKNFKYKYLDKEYSILTRHGFARDNKFKIVAQSEKYVKLGFSSNEDTLKKYPFEFNLYLIYTLIENGFTLEYQVENLNEGEMYFSIGAHPAFILSDNYENEYYIEFNREEDGMKFILDDEGFINGEKNKIELIENKKFFIKDCHFENDAIIFENPNSNIVYIKSKNTTKQIKIDYTEFPYIAFWKMLKAPFVCVEPWFGITDLTETDGNLKTKKGIQKLKKNGIFKSKLLFEFKEGN